jgi:ribosomal protein S18 acetylase RimI-like enzyme
MIEGSADRVSPSPALANYTIRKAKPEDVDALVEIETLAFPPEKYAGMTMSRRSFAEHVRSGRNELLVAVDKTTGVVAGYSLGFVRDDSPYIRFYSIAVRPDHEGRGAGRLLFSGIEDAARKRKLKGVRLEIRADNTRLQNRYERGGYVIFRTVKDYYPDGVAALRLYKDIVD